MIESDRNFLRARFSPIDESEFLEEFWPDQQFVIHGPLERLPPPFNNPELADFKRLFSHYTGRITFGKGSKGPRSFLMQNVNPLHLYEMGLSLYLIDIDPFVAGATEFLRQLERSLGLGTREARITAWASPCAEGIACHFDAEEVISIQLQGVKRFYVAEKKALISPVGLQYSADVPPTSEHYLQCPDGFPHPKDFEFTEIEMKPGSVLFMPRGVWHRTEADNDSLSISIVLSPTNAADCLLRELRNLLLQNPDWRRPIYGDFDRVNDLLKTLPDIVKTINPQNLSPLPEAARLETLKLSTRFQRIPDVYLSWEKNSPTALVRVMTKLDNVTTAEIQIPTAYIPVIEWLEASRAAFSVQDLHIKFNTISMSEHQALIPLLVRANFLKLLWFDKLTQC